MTDEIKGMPAFEFMIGLEQARHNKENPNHRCECKSVAEMILKHFEMHKEQSDGREYEDHNWLK